MRGRLAAALTAFAVMSVVAGVHIAQADTSMLVATHDTYSTQNDPNTAHGGNVSLKVNAAPAERRAFLRFTVSGVPDGSTEVGAVLRLRATTTSSATFTAWSVDATWVQSTLTWNNQPALGAAVTARTGVTGGQYNDFDLSSHVTGNGTFAVAITSSSASQTWFDSREAANGTPPQLVMSWTPPTTTTAATTTTDTTTTTSGTTTTTSGTTTTTDTTTTTSSTTTSSTTTSSTTTTTVPPADDPKVAAAGDIACAPPGNRTTSSCHQQATSNLLAAGDYDAVVPVGDLQYECGQASAYAAVYNPSWGRFKSKTRPVHGDHEFTGSCSTPGSAGYYSYFAGAASPRQPTCTSSCQGYYSYELGTWHVVVLNTDCSQPGVGGCSSSTPQGRWLAADLAAHPNECILAFWHLPRWGESGGISSASNYFASALYNAGAEVVVSGNTHFYARSAPQNPNGGADPVNGIRQFIVGTGGRSLHGLDSTPDPQVEVRQNTTFGILELTLHASSYSWRFVPEAGRTFTDSGTNSCH